MGFIEEAEIMLENAHKATGGANKALRVGWLTLAKDTISAAVTEAKKGVKAQDGHMPGQMSIDDKPRRGRPRRTVKASADGVVMTPADEAVHIVADPDDDEDNDGDPEDAAALTARLQADLDALPTEADYDAAQAALDTEPSRLDALAEHRRHFAEAPGLYREDCAYCEAAAAGRTIDTVAHGDHNDTTEDIPRINDTRPIPDGEGVTVQ